MDFPVPPVPNEIISEILSHLGKNDLLKCRLVSQSWNGLALKILRNPKYGHEHELTQDNIQKFLEFSNDRNEEWVIPFHLNFKRDEESMVYRLGQIPKYIQQLQQTFGEKCVVGLTLSHESTSTLEPVKELMSILTLIAPSLTHLDLSQFKLNFQEKGETSEMDEILEKTQFYLSNLSKLVSCPAPHYFSWEYGENVIHLFLTDKSDNLKELEVITPFDLLNMHNHIGSLRKLKIVNELRDMDMYLESTRTCPFQPVLRDLSFNYCADSLDHDILHEFLTFFSTTLQSLTVIFQEIPTTPFPKLSQLRFLRIQVLTRIGHIISVDPEKLNLNCETFPVLHSMDIQTNVYFEPTLANSWVSNDDWILRTVKTLSIRVVDSPFNERTTANYYADHVQQLFPNVTSLTLVNESDGHEEYLKQLLIAFIQSDGAPKLRELEIQNCEKNYLGHILNGLNPDCQPIVIIQNTNFDEQFLKAIKQTFKAFSGGIELSVDKQIEYRDDGSHSRVITCKAPILDLKMTGLEKIRMTFLMENEVNQRSRQWGRKQESNQNQKDLFLMSLPKYLPLLRQIDISQRLFGEDKEFCKQQIINVQEKFPELVINTTN